MRRLSTISGMQVKSLMTLLLTMIAMTLLALLLTLFPTPIQAATPFTTNGNFSVGSDGSANYSIPIQVPPGTSGMTPTLSLNYNSNGGNGILGMGWGLDGLSQISRCPKTIIQDGAVGGVNYDVNDKLCLDGQRLISTGGTYGGNATEYRTEQANFAKIISYTSTTANGPDYFKVWTKAGQIIEYGNSPDSRIEAAGKAVVRTWGVSKISDTKGNYLTVSYTEDNANGEAYIQRIDYTGNASSTPVVTPYASVQFSYETRPDISTGYHAGSVIKSTKRISNIKTYAPASTTNNTPTLVKDYRLTYEQGTATQRSRLKTLTECDGQTTPTCQQAVGLGWQEDIRDFSAESEWANNNNWAGFGWQGFDDFNGDGKADLWFVNPSSSRVMVRLSTGSNFSVANEWANNNNWAGIDWKGFADFNGDGKADLWFVNPSSSRVMVRLSTGNSFSAESEWANNNAWAGDGWWGFSDFNGDGLPDLWFVNSGSSRVLVRLSTGSSFAPEVEWANNNAWAGLGWTGFDDFNGDGLPDLWFVNSGSSRVLVRLSTGSSFAPEVEWANNNAWAGLAWKGFADFKRRWKARPLVCKFW